MQIHVVSSGETLFSIARQYDVPAGILARYNGLAEPYRLAVGQSLLILRPTSLVTVRAGDTLSSLARQNGQSVRSLLRLNPNLTQQTAIYPGQIVVTAIEDAPERTAAAFGYAYSYVSPSVAAEAERVWNTCAVVWPRLSPVTLAVKDGTESLAVMVALLAVTVSVEGTTVRV